MREPTQTCELVMRDAFAEQYQERSWLAYGLAVSLKGNIRCDPNSIARWEGQAMQDFRWRSAITLLALCLPGAAYAQASPPVGQPASQVVTDLLACRSIVDEARRLQCFDQAAATFEEAQRQRQITIVDSAAVQEARRSLFGLSLPKIRLFQNTEEEERAESVTGTIRNVKTIRGGLWVVQIDDAVWQTTETGYFQMLPKVGQQATVTRGPLGSFRLAVAGRNGLRATRIR